MKHDFSMILVGALVLGGLALGIGAIALLGTMDWLAETSEVVVLIDESVSGLEEGAAVKLRGVKIGQVSGVDVVCDLKRAHTVVVLKCSVQSDALADFAGDRILFRDKDSLWKLIDKGLRAKVALAGVTGLRYLALDFYDPREHPATYPEHVKQVAGTDLVIPTIPSTISELTESAAEILAELREADLAGIAARFSTALDESKQTLESVRETSQHLSSLIADVSAADARQIADAVITTLEESKQTLESFREASQGLSHLLSEVSADDLHQITGAFSQTLAKANESLRSIDEAAGNVTWFFGGESGIDTSVSDTLEAIGEAAPPASSCSPRRMENANHRASRTQKGLRSISRSQPFTSRDT